MLCGPAGAGKTTFAGVLVERGVQRVSYDEEFWRAGYRGTFPPPATMRVIEARLRQQVLATLGAGHPVVLDYSFSQRATRDEHAALIREGGGEPVLVSFDVPLAELQRRVAERNRRTGANAFPMTPQTLAEYVADFEVPTRDEHPISPDALLDRLPR